MKSLSPDSPSWFLCPLDDDQNQFCLTEFENLIETNFFPRLFEFLFLRNRHKNSSKFQCI